MLKYEMIIVILFVFEDQFKLIQYCYDFNNSFNVNCDYYQSLFGSSIFKLILLQCLVYEYHTSLVNCKLNVVSMRSCLMTPKFVGEKTLGIIMIFFNLDDITYNIYMIIYEKSVYQKHTFISNVLEKLISYGFDNFF